MSVRKVAMLVVAALVAGFVLGSFGIAGATGKATTQPPSQACQQADCGTAACPNVSSGACDTSQCGTDACPKTGSADCGSGACGMSSATQAGANGACDSGACGSGACANQ